VHVAELGLVADPERATHVVAFERSVAGGPWERLGSDDSSPVYSFTDLLAGLAAGTRVAYRATLTEPDGTTVTSSVRTIEVAPPPLATATVHYRRPAGDFAGWGLHLWGDAIASGVATDWATPRPPTAIDGQWATFVIPLKDDTKPVNFIVHIAGQDTREPGGDRSFVPIDHPEIWLVQDDPVIHFTQPATG
jgi:hypothetical protein